jgi:hypothetical protein
MEIDVGKGRENHGEGAVVTRTLEDFGTPEENPLVLVCDDEFGRLAHIRSVARRCGDPPVEGPVSRDERMERRDRPFSSRVASARLVFGKEEVKLRRFRVRFGEPALIAELMSQLAALNVPVEREGDDAVALAFPETPGDPPEQAQVELDFVLRVLTLGREAAFELEEL